MAAKKKADIIIREAEPFDTVNIARLLVEWFKDTGVEFPEPADWDLHAWVTDTMANGKVWIAQRSNGGRPVGVLGVTPSQFRWNRAAAYLGDSFFFVSPSYRRGGVAKAMMTKAKTFAAANSLPLIMANLSGIKVNEIERFYRIEGGTQLGGIVGFGLQPKQKGG